MYNIGKKMLLILAVFTVIAHSILPHVHLYDVVAITNHHHHPDGPAHHHHSHDDHGSQEKHHNLFSFAQLDDDFIPAKGPFKKFELPVQYLSPVAITYLLDTFPVYIKKVFGRYKEYPPPDNYFFNLPSRAPPAFYLS